ncbi:hypothetical protein ACXR6G_05750 [Ancylomarina sp. YFZ004]
MKNLVQMTLVLCLLIMVFSSRKKNVLDEAMHIGQNNESFDTRLESVGATGFNIYGYNWNAHEFNGYLLNAWVGDNLVPHEDYYHWKPCSDDTKDNLELYSDEDRFFWNFRNWTAHHFNGYLLNTWLGDNIAPLVDYYHWDPYTGDAEDYLNKYPAERFFFWDFRDMILEMHWSESLISSEGVYRDPWLGSDAWITFHYKMGEGKDKWSQFLKMIAVKESDILIKDEDGYGLYWVNENEEFIGYYYMWPDLALIQVENTGDLPDGMCPAYKGPMSPGLEKYKAQNLNVTQVDSVFKSIEINQWSTAKNTKTDDKSL